MTNQQQNPMEEFFKIFTESVVKTLSKNLDKETCKQIDFYMTNAIQGNNSDQLSENKALYKIDYATGNNQGTLIVLIPEELIATITDVLMGGTGQEAYKGNLSELETNSMLDFLNKIFKDMEGNFKQLNDHDLAFSTSPLLLLKDMSEYDLITSEAAPLDLIVNNTLSLNEGQEYSVNLLLSNYSIEHAMDALGFKKSVPQKKEIDISLLNVKRLADVKINIMAELGKTRVPIKYALELVRGSVIELDTLNNADIKVFANGVEFAHAQVVAVEDNFGLKITKIISPEERLEHI